MGKAMATYECGSTAQSVKHVQATLLITFGDQPVEAVATRLDVGFEDYCASTCLLSDAERQRAGRFASNRVRRRFVVARARLRQLLGARLGVRPESVELVFGAHGKPALARRYAASGLHFNASHSEDVAVYAFSIGREIGVDVEALRVIRDADAIAARFFSRTEYQAYLALDPRDRPAGFFNCWTRKEAFVKALGDGLHYPLDRFDVSLAPDEPAKILRVANTTGEECGWTVHCFVPEPGFIGAVVVQKTATELASVALPKTVAAHSRRRLAGSRRKRLDSTLDAP
jgi:4'-phosphopantetheinyl transferase